MTVRKQNSPLRARFRFDDGSHEDLSLIELETERLLEMDRLLHSANSLLREIGQAVRAAIAARLARERQVAVRQKATSEIGAEKRRSEAKKKAQKVAAAIAQHRNPVGVSERHVRRIKARLAASDEARRAALVRSVAVDHDERFATS